MGYPMSSILGRYNPSISQGIVSKTSGFGEIVWEIDFGSQIFGPILAHLLSVVEKMLVKIALGKTGLAKSILKNRSVARIDPVRYVPYCGTNRSPGPGLSCPVNQRGRS